MLASTLLIACNNKVTLRKENQGFYYWKNGDYQLKNNESKLLDTFETAKMYVKLFEVNYDSDTGPIPYAKSSLGLSFIDDDVELIPCVYIRNNVFKEASRKELIKLADNINYLVIKRIEDKSIKYIDLNELQIDSDWTESTSGNYFFFLRELKKLWKKTISCTLRLYPYKFSEKMGVPPCDKVMLMCYNLRNPGSSPNMNSILDKIELEKYLYPKKNYPLPIDIALPIYSWNLCYQNEHYKGKINGEIENIDEFTMEKTKLWNQIIKDTVIDDVYLRKGDLLKVEKINTNLLIDCSKIILETVTLNKESSIVIYQLDENNINSNSYDKISSVYASFCK